MSRIIMITSILATVVAAYTGMPWLQVLLWGSIATCVAAAAEAGSFDPLPWGVVPSVLLVHPQVFEGFRADIRSGLMIGLSILAALAATEMRRGCEPGLGRTDSARDAAELPGKSVAKGVSSTSTPPGGQG